MIKETASKILKEGYVCDHCLGRQFANLLSGYTNDERGRFIRSFLAMEYEVKPFKVSLSNFYGFIFRKRKLKPDKPGSCVVCKNLFERLPEFAKDAKRKLKPIDFKTFMVGVKMSDSLAIAEESLWEKSGIAYCESLKSEINRELGKLIEKETGKTADEKKPDVIVMLNLQNKRIEITINPMYVYGMYKKFARGIPQTKISGYRYSVADMIARPLIKFTKGSGYRMHACGREDMKARCLAWRPFILDISQPLKREINMKNIERVINKGRKVKVKGLRCSSAKEIVELKKRKMEKVYSVKVSFKNPVEGIERVKKIVGIVSQRTPKRILHAQPDKVRYKKVKNIRWKKISTKTYEFKIRMDAGLYIKELVTGDNGRTKPSISGLLKNDGRVEEFDVIKIVM